MADWSPEKQAEVKKSWMSLRERSAELAMVGLKELERQRDEARARGDQAEFERLDEIVRTQSEQLERMRANPQQPMVPALADPTPEAQPGPVQ
jgi:hypothetical protein